MKNIAILTFILLGNYTYAKSFAPKIFVPPHEINESNENTLDSEMSRIISFNEFPYSGAEQFAINYFYNLRENFPNNRFGICSFVSVSMLLQYYDTFWNDDFISEIYESDKTTLSTLDDSNYNYESPGVYDVEVDSYLGLFNDNKSDFVVGTYFGYPLYSASYLREWQDVMFDYIDDTINTESFLGKLFEIAIDNNLIIRRNYIFNSINEPSPALSYYDIQTLISLYLSQLPISNYVGVDYRLYEGEGNNTQQEIVSFAKNQLLNGNPVIFGGTHTSDDGVQGEHVCIAYEYDQENDIIYGNQGWQGNLNTRYNLNTYFNTEVKAAYAITINSPLVHKHSRHYRIGLDFLGNCSCELESHTHRYIYNTFSDEQHIKKCFCVDGTAYETHLFTRTQIIGANEYAICDKCNYSKFIGNSPIVGY